MYDCICVIQSVNGDFFQHLDNGQFRFIQDVKYANSYVCTFDSDGDVMPDLNPELFYDLGIALSRGAMVTITKVIEARGRITVGGKLAPQG